MRAAVDLCHRDGSLKRAVAADPGRYIHEVRNLGMDEDIIAEALPFNNASEIKAGKGKEGCMELFPAERTKAPRPEQRQAATVSLHIVGQGVGSDAPTLTGVCAAQDLRLAPMLDTLRASGRQVFLATNSLWDYTHIVMVCAQVELSVVSG